MKHYIVYDPGTGEIEISGTCSPEQFDGPVENNKCRMEAEASTATHFVSNGLLVAYTAQQAAAKADRPSHRHKWDNTTFSWIEASPPVESQEVRIMVERERRNDLLAKSDWTDTLSAKERLGEALYSAWQEYRQALRDLTNQAGFPHQITWPEPPSPT